MSHPKESIILGRLLQRQDPTYRDFHKKLLPTVDPERLIGVRTPQLRSLAKELSGTPEAEDFLASLPHTYYDENTLHGLLISNGKDISWVIAQLDRFLPFVDNWATCDLTRPKIFQKHLLRRNRQLVLPGIVFQRPVLRLWRIFRLILRGHADITCGFLPCFHTAPPLCFKTYVKTQERIPLSMHNVLAER